MLSKTKWFLLIDPFFLILKIILIFNFQSVPNVWPSARQDRMEVPRHRHEDVLLDAQVISIVTMKYHEHGKTKTDTEDPSPSPFRWLSTRTLLSPRSTAPWGSWYPSFQSSLWICCRALNSSKWHSQYVSLPPLLYQSPCCPLGLLFRHESTPIRTDCINITRHKAVCLTGRGTSLLELTSE